MNDMVIIKDKLRILENSAWHIAVVEYGISHRVMRVAFYRDHFLNRIEFVGGGSELVGRLETGPVLIAVVYDASGQVIGIDAQDGSFTWRFSRLRWADRPLAVDQGDR